MLETLYLQKMRMRSVSRQYLCNSYCRYCHSLMLMRNHCASHSLTAAAVHILLLSHFCLFESRGAFLLHSLPILHCLFKSMFICIWHERASWQARWHLTGTSPSSVGRNSENAFCLQVAIASRPEANDIATNQTHLEFELTQSYGNSIATNGNRM